VSIDHSHDCIHGIDTSWCSICKPRFDSGGCRRTTQIVTRSILIDSDPADDSDPTPPHGIPRPDTGDQTS
jgi:hypothetical protein